MPEAGPGAITGILHGLLVYISIFVWNNQVIMDSVCKIYTQEMDGSSAGDLWFSLKTTKAEGKANLGEKWIGENISCEPLKIPFTH